MADINLTWNGATDDNGINCYELQWRLSADSPWSTPPILINHDSSYNTNTLTTGGGSYSHAPTQFVDHYFRIRIMDSVGQYSPYKEIFVSVDTSNVLISSTSSLSRKNVCISQTFNPIDSIVLLDTSSNIVSDNIAIGYIVRTINDTIFNGYGRFWRILLLDGSKWNCKISTLGVITQVIACELSNIKSELISDSFLSLSTTNSLVCEASLYYEVYYEGTIGVGTIVYNILDGGVLSSPFPGANRYYLISERVSTYFVKIANNGSISSIQTYLSVCPINISSDNCCFVAGTEISMFDKSIKLIEDIKVGDSLITYNEELKIQEIGEVKRIISPYRSDIIEYKLSNKVIIKSTSCHPYFVINKGWSSFNPELTKRVYDFDVEKIELNDILIDIGNNEVSIIEIIELITKEVKTYNLELSGNHTYYANGILVHNKFATNTNEPIRYDEFGNQTSSWTNWNAQQSNCIIYVP